MMSSIGQQASDFWQNQSVTRRITIIALLLSALILIAVFVFWATQPSYSVAFTGLSEEDAGLIIEQLQATGTQYKLRNESTILVPSKEVYEVRLAMAKEGLPQSSSVGYEVFNGNSFIMTEFTQQVNYQRALEGELERTIANLETVDAVRVHIVVPEQALLTEDQQPATASVTLQVGAGKTISQTTVRSITHLVASSVENMDPEHVVVVDSAGNLLAGGSSEGEMAIVSQTDAHRAAEVAAAQNIEQKVEDLLENVLGPDRSVVQANVVMDWTQREVTSQTFSPEQSSIRSSQNVQEDYTTTGETGGVPGAEENLPENAITDTTSGQLLDYNRTEETINYEVSQEQVVEIEAPGQITQVSLSVLVDGVEDQTELQTLRSAVIAAAGINEARGDVVAVANMSFDRTYFEEQAADFAKETRTDTIFQIAEIAVPVLIVALLLFFLWRLFSNLRKVSGEAWVPVMQPVSEAALGSPIGQPMIGAGISGDGLEMGEGVELLEEEGDVELPSYSTPSKASYPEDEQLQRVLTRMAEENPATVAEIIQLWLHEDSG